MRRADIITGTLIFVGGLAMIFVVVPIQIESAGDYGLDPKFFPTSVLWLLIALGALLAVTRLATAPEAGDDEPVLTAKNWLFIGGLSAFFIAVFVGIKVFGYMAAGAVAAAALGLLLEPRKPNWVQLAAVAILTPVVIYYTLYYVFSVRLPAGSLLP